MTDESTPAGLKEGLNKYAFEQVAQWTEMGQYFYNVIHCAHLDDISPCLQEGGFEIDFTWMNLQ